MRPKNSAVDRYKLDFSVITQKFPVGILSAFFAVPRFETITSIRLLWRANLVGVHAHFALDPALPLFDDAVEWANWNALGPLIVARQGLIHRYTLSDLASGQPSMTWDLRTF